MRKFKIEPKNIFGETVECAVFEDGTLRLVRENPEYGKYLNVPNWSDKNKEFKGIHDIYNAIKNDDGDIACNVNIAGKEEIWVIRLLDRTLGEKIRQEQLEKFDNPEFGWGLEVEEDDIKYAIGLFGEKLNDDDELAICFKSREEVETHIIALKQTESFSGKSVIPVQCISPKKKEMLIKEYTKRAQVLSQKIGCEAEAIFISFINLDNGQSIYNAFNSCGLGKLKMKEKKLVMLERQEANLIIDKIKSYMI